MFETLNLLPKTQLKTKQANKIVAVLQIAARVLVVIFIMVLIAEYGWAAFTQQQIVTTKSRSSALQEEINQQSEVEGRYLYYQQVLNSATSIIEKRKNFLASLSELYSRLEPGVTVEGITFTDTSLLFSGIAPNVQVYAATLDNFRVVNETNKLFGNMVLQTSTRGPDGKYAFQVEIELLSSEQVIGS